MFFKRKVYDQLLDWKKNHSDKYAVMLEGARRVGKSTIAELFAKNEYKSYVLIDFSTAPNNVLKCFDDIHDLDMFFLRLNAVTSVKLYEHESAIVFDEVQLFPKARQAIKHLVKDGRYHYIETGSLISIKKNVTNILIPSEEMKIQVYPMDYEEFCGATGRDFSVLENLYEKKKAVGQEINRKLMRDMRLYMAVGGMPQAVEAFVGGKNFSEIDHVKRQILSLYEDDFAKIDPTGRVSLMFHSIPSQLAKGVKKYRLSAATGKKKTNKDETLFSELVNSKTVLPAYNTTDPRTSLSSAKDLDSYKLYLLDTGLFITLMFIDRAETENVIYEKLLSDKLPANLGYLYENLVAQILTATGRELYYHTWDKENSTHYYEVDFLISDGSKVSPIEVKSSGTGKCESIIEFRKKYSDAVQNMFVLSQKDFGKKGELQFVPIYEAMFL